MNTAKPRSRVAWTATVAVCLSAALAADGAECPYGELEWDDFQGTPPDPPPADADAETVSGAFGSWGTPKAEPSGNGFKAKLTNVQTEAKFSKRGSWVKPGSEDDDLLEHEQYHFDISEHWARELEKLLNGVEGTGDTAAEAQMDANAKGNAAMQQCQTDCDALQEAYDDETMHGMDEDKQEMWCEIIGDLLESPEPEKDVSKSSESGAFVEDQDGTASPIVFFPGSVIDSFDCEGVPFVDPFLVGGSIYLPALAFEGYQMGGQRARLIPIEGNDDSVVVTDSLGGTALQGRLRLLMSDVPGTSYTGWIEAVTLDPAALAQSPFLQLVEGTLAGGEAIVTVELQLGQSLEAATNDFTQPAFVPGSMALGSAVDGFEPWADLGGALAGTGGEPDLFAVGTLIPGQIFSLVVSKAFPSSPTFLGIGFSQVNQPLFGGTLVTSAEIIVNLATDADGFAVFSTMQPQGIPSGFTYYCQAWIVDPGAVEGFSATNGVSGTAP